MMKIIKSICIALPLSIGSAYAGASDTKGAPEEAIAMVKRAAAYSSHIEKVDGDLIVGAEIYK